MATRRTTGKNEHDDSKSEPYLASMPPGFRVDRTDSFSQIEIQRELQQVRKRLLALYPEKWSLQRNIILALPRCDSIIKMEEAYCMARNWANLENVDRIADKFFLASIRHAICQIRWDSYELFQKGQNRQGILLKLPQRNVNPEESIGWCCSLDLMQVRSAREASDQFTACW